MSNNTFRPILKQTGPKVDDFDLACDGVAGIRHIPACLSAYVESVGDQYRTVALFDIQDILNQKLAGGQSIVYLDPEEVGYKKAAPALYKELKYIQEWLAQGDCDPSFSDPIDAALGIVESHREGETDAAHD